MPIPNILHFINIGPREFNLLHFLSIISAYAHNKPLQVFIYCDHEQEDNIYWEILKNILTVIKVKSPDEYKGVKLDSYHYKADIIRMQKLIEKGGIYLDLDVLSLKPLTGFLNKNIILGAEAADDPDTQDLDKFKSITNAVIITEPNNEFMKYWFDEMPKNINGKPWAYHAVCLPQILLQENQKYKSNVHLEPRKSFMPFCFRDDYFFKKDKKNRRSELDESYTVHLWENIWKDEYISKLDVGYFNSNDNLLTELFGKYIDILYQNIGRIMEIVKNSFIKGNKEKVQYYGKMYLDLCERYKQEVDVDMIKMIFKTNNVRVNKCDKNDNPILKALSEL